MKNAYCSRYVIHKREVTGVDNLLDEQGSLPEQDWILMYKDVDRSTNILPSHYRNVLVSIAMDGKGYDDAADDLHCAVGTIKNRLNRARQALQQQFGTASV